MPPGARRRGAARSVVAICRRAQPCSAPIDADQQFLDQESIVEDDLHY
jgi:hypothetical protein